MRYAFLNPQGNFDPDDSYLTEHPDFGGQLVYVKEVCLALADMGVNVDIVTRRVDDPKWRGFAGQIDYYRGYEGNPRIVRVDCGEPSFLNKEHLWPHLAEFVANTLSIYGENPPGFATAHYADAGYCAALLREKIGLDFTFTGHSLGAQKLDKLGTTSANADAMERQYRFSRRIAAERLSMQLAYNIITSTSQERYEQYAHSLYQGAVNVDDDAKFSIIPPGVNTRIFTTSGAMSDEDVHRKIAASLAATPTPYVIASSRLDEKKNILGLVRAYAHSKALRESARLCIFIRGVPDPWFDQSSLSATETGVLAPILQTIAQGGIRNKVDFLDIRSQQELAAAYRYFAQRGSVFALTSFYEPFGLAPLEAAACGLAVVATNNGGPTEIFADGSGVLVNPEDEEEIAKGLHTALSDHPGYTKKGQQRVRSTYTWNKTAEAYLAVMQRGIEAGRIDNDIVIPALDCRDRIGRYLDETT
ncbi:MAG: glycosyltransferase [Gammaproteobacteria bacterium]